MKKLLLWLVMLVMILSLTAVFSLSGCEKGGTTTTTAGTTATTAAAGEEEEEEEVVYPETSLEILMWEEALTPGVQAQIDMIEETYNITSNLELILGGPEGETIIKQRIATGEMPDILLFNSGALLHTLNPADNFVDLSDQSFAQNFTTDFNLAASVDGKLYGVPANFSGVGGMVYNKDIYEELDLDIPTTWDAFIDNCETIQDAGYTAIEGSFGDSWSAQLILLADFFNVNALDPDFADDYTANKAHFADTPAALRSFEKLAETTDLMNEDYTTTTFGDAFVAVAGGEVGHYPMLNFAIYPAMAADYSDAYEFMGMFPQPSDDPSINGFTAWAPNGWFVTNSCTDLDTAMLWMEAFSTQESIDAYAEEETISGPVAIKGITLPSNTLDVVFELQDYFDAGNSAPALEFLSPIKGPNLPQICVEVGSGMKTALEGAEAYDADVLAQAQQLGIEGW